MFKEDTACTLVPYFRIHPGKSDDFRAVCTEFVGKTRDEPGCLFYGFSFDGDEAHCREGYEDANAVLAHLENVGDLLQKALGLADITRLEVHGPADQIDQLRGPLGEMSPQFFTLELGFRRA